MQQPLFPQLTSCGNWAADVLRDNPFLEQLILAGPDQKSMEGIPEKLAEDRKEKLICISREEIKEGKSDEKVSRIHMELPIYISIDKDVLAPLRGEDELEPGRYADRCSGKTAAVCVQAPEGEQGD